MRIPLLLAAGLPLALGACATADDYDLVSEDPVVSDVLDDPYLYENGAVIYGEDVIWYDRI